MRRQLRLPVARLRIIVPKTRQLRRRPKSAERKRIRQYDRPYCMRMRGCTPELWASEGWFERPRAVHVGPSRPLHVVSPGKGPRKAPDGNVLVFVGRQSTAMCWRVRTGLDVFRGARVIQSLCVRPTCGTVGGVGAGCEQGGAGRIAGMQVAKKKTEVRDRGGGVGVKQTWGP